MSYAPPPPLPPPPGLAPTFAYPALPPSHRQTPGFSVGVELQQQKFDIYAANRGHPMNAPGPPISRPVAAVAGFAGTELGMYGAQGYLTNAEQQRWETGSMTSEFKKAGCNCDNCRRKKLARKKSRRRNKRRSWFSCFS